jgi:hypothetical protein
MRKNEEYALVVADGHRSQRGLVLLDVPDQQYGIPLLRPGGKLG